MLKLSIHTFFSFCRLQKNTFFLLLGGICTILFAMLFILSRYYMVYEEVKNEYQETKTLTVNIEESLSAKAQQQWNDFFQKKISYSKVEKIMLIDLQHNIIGCEAPDRSVMNIFYGHFFSEEERKGENVVLLSEGYLRQQDADFIKNMLSREITLEDSTYKVIGSYNLAITGDVLSSKEVVIPLATYIKNGYAFNQMVIVFYDIPTSEMINSIEDFLKRTEVAYSIYLPTKYEKSAAIQALDETIWSLLILGVCFISMFPMLYYWNKSNFRRLYIYYICGCSTKKISFILFANTTYLYMLASAAALMLYHFFKKIFCNLEFIRKLEINQICLLYLVVFLVIILFVKIQMHLFSNSRINFLTHTKKRRHS